MAGGLEIHGTSGELRVGYQLAARFGPWTLMVSRGDVVVTVSDLQPDAYWFPQQPDTLRLEIGSRAWVWRAIERDSDIQYRLIGDPEVQ
jgi:hypothetical protein